jgi:hypothetical protein
MRQEPSGEFLASAGIAAKRFLFCVPQSATAAGNLRVLFLHRDQEILSLRMHLMVVNGKFRFKFKLSYCDFFFDRPAMNDVGNLFRFYFHEGFLNLTLGH